MIRVSGPWPGYTTVSSGNDSNLSLIAASSTSWLPPHRSVRPMLPANKESPTITKPFFLL